MDEQKPVMMATEKQIKLLLKLDPGCDAWGLTKARAWQRIRYLMTHKEGWKSKHKCRWKPYKDAPQGLGAPAFICKRCLSVSVMQIERKQDGTLVNRVTRIPKT